MLLYFLFLLVVWVALHYLLKFAAKFFHGLYEPVQQTVDLFKNDVEYAVSYWTVQGQRPYQEDRMQQLRVPSRALCAEVSASANGSSAPVEPGASSPEGVRPGAGAEAGAVVHDGSRSGGGSLYGVFDGHGGHRAAEYCRNFLLHNVANDERFSEDAHGSLFRGFLKSVTTTNSSFIVKLQYYWMNH
jgi:hypothetical protein